MASVFDSLYTRLILRDVVGKIVPGSALLISLYFAALPAAGGFHAVIDAVRTMPASSWVIVAAMGWLTAFAIQALGGWLPTWRFLPYIRYSAAPLEDMFEYQRRHLRFARVASDAEKLIFERATVVKEACGNAVYRGVRFGRITPCSLPRTRSTVAPRCHGRRSCTADQDAPRRGQAEHFGAHRRPRREDEWATAECC